MENALNKKMGEELKQDKASLLVVDDEKGIRDIFSRILTEEGYQVETAEDGYQAMRAFKKRPFDLVLADIKMPGMDGIKLLEEIKKINSETEVLIITGYSSVESAAQAVGLGASAYILKPTDINNLSLDIESALIKQRLRKENNLLMERLQRVNKKNASILEDLKGSYKELKATEAKLIQSAKLAAIGTLAAGVAHELSNPLTIIAGRTELLLMDEEKDPESRNNLMVTMQQVDRAEKIVQNLLSFSRRCEQHLRPIEANPLLQETIDLLEYQLSHNRIRVTRKFEPELPKMLGDGNQLQQAFVNIITNACQSMRKGGILTVATRKTMGKNDIHPLSRSADLTFFPKVSQNKRRISNNGVSLQIDFSDTGCGIASKNLSKAFEPFFTTKPSGTGLGLSITHDIVKAHNGIIGVASKRGKGTTFSLIFPTWNGNPG